jgi:hypothetical protein
MRSNLEKFLIVAAFLLLVNSGVSYGDVIVSNLSATVNGTGTVYGSGPPQAYAQGFETGSSSVVLASIIAALGDAAPTFTASAELVADNGGLPSSAVLTTFTVPSIPTSSFADLTFTPNSSVTLSANTDYWFILSASGSGDFKWQYTDTLSASFPNYAVSNNSGATWTIGSPAGPFWMEADSPAPVPEPSSLVLLISGLLGLLARRLRTREALKPSR